MTSGIPFTFPLARYRFEFEATTAIRLPEYAGSALRGAFGHALRQLSCVTRAKTCTGCLLVTTCPYTGIFEPPASGSLSLATPPVPYVIEPPSWGARQYATGERIAFHFTLAGRAIDQLPLCIMAWRRAFLRGVGAGDGTAELIGVSHEGSSAALGMMENRSNNLETTTTSKLIHRPGETVADHPRNLVLDEQTAPRSVTLEFITPLRLQQNGHALPPSRLTPRTLLMALARRASLLAEHYQGALLLTQAQFTELAHAATAIEGQAQMQWRDWTRYSSRQRCTMQLGGCIGNWTLEGNLAPFWHFLRLGVHLHVGKEAAFGLGQYRVLPCP